PILSISAGCGSKDQCSNAAVAGLQIDNECGAVLPDGLDSIPRNRRAGRPCITCPAQDTIAHRNVALLRRTPNQADQRIWARQDFQFSSSLRVPRSVQKLDPSESRMT